MEMRASLFISSLILAVACLGQEIDSLKSVQPAQSDSISIESTEELVEEDTIKIPRKFLSVEPYLDFGKLLTIPTEFETKYEGGLELRFYERFSLIAEAGSVTTSPEGAYSNGVYESSGIYYRVGVGYVGQLDAKHHTGISFRYASSSFEETGSFFIESPSGVQEGFTQRVNRSDLSAQWWEVVFYSDRKLFDSSDLFWFGLNIRFRILQRYDEQDVPDVYAIPGYGRAFDQTIPGANFFLKLKF